MGKSTLYNRVVGSRKAVVEDVAGVTRDRSYSYVERFAVPFYLVDSGGLEKDPAEELQQFVVEQAILAAEEADLILAIFDGKDGCQEGDRDVVELLRQYDKPILFGVNKCDGVEQGVATADFYSLGLEEIQHFSALHGRGVSDFIEQALRLLPNYSPLCDSAKAAREREEAIISAAEQEVQVDEPEVDDDMPLLKGGDAQPADREKTESAEPCHISVVEPDFAPVFIPGETELSEDEYDRRFGLLDRASREFSATDSEEAFVRDDGTEDDNLPELECISVAIIGRPNVGKSTLLNTLTGEQRAVTSPMAGTTRDAIDMKIRREGQDYLLIDTAGLRRKARISDKVEKYAVFRAMGAINRCDVAVILLDAVAGPTEQDAKIVGLAHDQGKGIVLLVNKWDIVEKDHRSVQEYKQRIRDTFKFSPYAPVLFVSAKTGKRCPKVISTVREVAQERAKRVPTMSLNRVLKAAQQRMNTQHYRGRPIRLLYGTQIDTAPPRFLLFFNFPHAVHFSILRFIKNAIREEFGFSGTDIKLVTRKRA